MSFASKARFSEVTLAAAANATQIFRDTERVCQRLEDWTIEKHIDPAVIHSILELAQSCRRAIQQCREYFADNEPSAQAGLIGDSTVTPKKLMSQNKTSDTRSTNQDASRIEALVYECKRRTSEVLDLLDKEIDRASNMQQPDRDHDKQQQQEDGAIPSLDTIDAVREEFWKGASPYTRVKIGRLREEAERLLLPELATLRSCLLEQTRPDPQDRSSSYGVPTWDKSLPSDTDLKRKQLEDRYTVCMEITSNLASSLLAQTSPLYIHAYANSSQVPYKEDTEVPSANGSFGVVYKVTDLKTGAVRAVKQLRKIYSAKKRNVVLKELCMLERCDHPNIIRLLDAYQVDDDPSTVFLVTDPWAPYTLSQFLHQTDSKRHAACPWFTKDSRQTERTIVKIFTGLADGLGYLHNQSVKHKDLKPENILLYNAGQETIRPIIADLGISKIFETGGSTDYYKSTYTYLAPEQIDSIESTLKADIWQMGCCFALTLAVFRAGSAGCRQLWNSFENSDGNCSCNIAKESVSFMRTLKDLCGSGTSSQRYAHWIISAMLEVIPAKRSDIESVNRELWGLQSMV